MKTEPVIDAVWKGTGENAIYFFTTDIGQHKSQIVDEIKQIGKQISCDETITILAGYIKGNLVFEMGWNKDVIVFYK